MKPFDSLTVPLEGSNLIEASAGTGKTYSIAILALRLILEEGLSLPQMLMVTFTNAAVAELEVRIRLFVRRAYGYACRGREGIDDTIKEVVDRALECYGKELVQERLTRAVRSLDETHIMTIHGFCQEVLQKFAFETEQAFQTEVLTDQSLLIERVVNRFWREKVTVLDKTSLDFLFSGKRGYVFGRETLHGFIKNVLDGKKLKLTALEQLPSENKESFIAQKNKEVEDAYADFVEHVKNIFSQLPQKAKGNGPALRMVDRCNVPADFIEGFEARYRGKIQFVETCFPKTYELYDTYIKLETKLQEYRLALIEELLLDLQERVVEETALVKSRKNVVGFDDLIEKVWLAVDKNKVNSVLQEEYKAVFIDEFQDTDKKQYEIFNRVFTATPVFYIGDPKQSIFAWRKADLNTYKLARSQVKHVYTMNQNFRSTPQVVKALNGFFSVDDAFKDEGIRYIPVESAWNRREMRENKEAVVPLTVCVCKKVGERADYACNRIVDLLSDSRFMLPHGKDGWRRIKPSDIGVIVRLNKEGRAIKHELAKRNIPAVTIDDTLLWDSEEALQIYYVLLAILSPNRKSLSRALLNPYFGYDTNAILTMDEDTELERFRELGEIWKEQGIYNALSLFLRMYKVRDFCSVEDHLLGQRTITNYLHIMELLHQAQIRKELSAEELVAWMAREMGGGGHGDGSVSGEYEQRIESDEDAVKITTIHKCKGLSYGIVFAPFLDFEWFSKPEWFLDFRWKEDYMISFGKPKDLVEIAKEQQEQENRRLLYVALTRAVFKCYACRAVSKKNSTLKPFVDHLGDGVPGLTDIWEYEPEPVRRWRKEDKEDFAPTQKFAGRNPFEVPAMSAPWFVDSFSSLVKKLLPPPQEELAVAPDFGVAAVVDSAMDGAYNAFIFDRLPKGIKTGLFVHTLFENIDFTQPEGWPKAIDMAFRMYPRMLEEEDKEHVLSLLTHVLSTELPGGVVLNCIKPQDKITEMAFFYEQNKRSLMTGLVDLFFRYNEKYYILDWKSNFLGNTLQGYDWQAVDRAVRENHYNLQYRIYARAALLYLQQKKEGFDPSRHFGGIFYLFVRGMRHGKTTGIYYKDAAQVLKEIGDV